MKISDIMRKMYSGIDSRKQRDRVLKKRKYEEFLKFCNETE